MIPSKSAEQAKDYYTASLAKSDYYLNDQELPGHFHGKLAERLGLKDQDVTREAFFALAENLHPGTGKQLTPRMKDDRITGYDVNFHCPKSVSLLHVLSKDNHIADAFQQSVSETMQDIEADAATRVRTGNRYEDRQTGELVFASFLHQTSRPVDGHVPDPHLHSHCFVFNATWDEQEQRFKAGKFRDIKRDMPYYQAMFHKRLADKMIALGYQVRRTPSAFEIKGVPQPVIEHFSKRTNEIGQIAKEKGITDATALAELGARTRAKKQKNLSMADLKADWKKQIASLSLDRDTSQPVRFAPVVNKDRTTPQACIEHAKLHDFERASVVPDRQLLRTAIRHSLGCLGVSIQAIREQFKKDKAFLHIRKGGRNLCTTKDVLAEEKRMVELAQNGQGKMLPLYSMLPPIDLKGQQGQAISHVLTTGNRVSIIRGAAGTGKTTLMQETVRHINKAGKRVLVAAPTAQASRGVLKDEGFEDATTVAALLASEKMQEDLQGQVLWVDEAGLLGTRDMADLLALVTRQNARLILGGDTRQHTAVVRGDALRILNAVAGIKAADVDRIFRQKNNPEYLKTVQSLADGNIKDAFDTLDKMGAIETIDPLHPHETLARDYVDTVKKGKTALIVSPTHKERDNVTDEIRKLLKQEGMISDKETIARRYTNLNFTEAEKGDWRNYRPGQVLQFSQNLPGIRRGSTWQVKQTEERDILIQNEQGQVLTLPRHKQNCFEVYNQSEIAFSKGDKVMITRNSYLEGNKRLDNGTILHVSSIHKDGSFTLRSRNAKGKFIGGKYVLGKDFGNISHAHCITSHASQGKTVDQVFIAQPAATFGATDLKQFYVSVSRGRDAVKIYTDDKAALLDHASELGDRQSALELVKEKSLHEKSVAHLQKLVPVPDRAKEPVKDMQADRLKVDLDYEPV